MMPLPLMHSAISFSGISGALTGNSSAIAFANEMLAAKSVMDATDEGEIQEKLPVIDSFMHSHNLQLPSLREGSGSRVDVGYFNNVFKPHFAHGLRRVFDARMSSRSFNTCDYEEMREFVSKLPDIAMAGLLTLNVVLGYCDEQKGIINEQLRRANGSDDGSQALATGVPPNAISVVIGLFGASLCLAALKYDNYLLTGLIVTCTILTMHFVGRTKSFYHNKPKITKRQKWDLQETLISLGILRTKLRTHRKDIISWSEMQLPPIH